MGAQFERFLEKYISAWYIPEIKVVDIIEIIIISVLVYEIMVWIKNTKAWMLLKGMLVLCAFILVAAIFERMKGIYYETELRNNSKEYSESRRTKTLLV